MGRGRDIRVERIWKVWVLVGGFIVNLQLTCSVCRVRLRMGFPRSQARLVTVNFCRQAARGRGIRVGYLSWSGSPLISNLSKVVAVLGSNCASRIAAGLLFSEGVGSCESIGPVPGRFFTRMSPVMFLKISSPLKRVFTAPGKKCVSPDCRSCLRPSCVRTSLGYVREPIY